LQQRTSNY